MADSVERMRRHGRSWTEIAEHFGITVMQAKSAVSDVRAEQRHALARTAPNERARGLLVQCGCGCPRKHHLGALHDGECAVCGPVVGVWKRWDRETVSYVKPSEPGYYRDEIGCNSFEEQGKATIRKMFGGALSDDLVLEARVISADTSWKRTLRHIKSGYTGPSLRASVRRARRKTKKANSA